MLLRNVTNRNGSVHVFCIRSLLHTYRFLSGAPVFSSHQKLTIRPPLNKLDLQYVQLLEHFYLAIKTLGVNKIAIINDLCGRLYLSNSKLLVVRIMCTVHAVSTPVSGHPLVRVLSSLRGYGNNFLGYLERHLYPLVAVVHSCRPCSNEPVNKGGYLVKKSYMFTLQSHKSSKLNIKDLVNCCVLKVVGLK